MAFGSDARCFVSMYISPEFIPHSILMYSVYILALQTSGEEINFMSGE